MIRASRIGGTRAWQNGTPWLFLVAAMAGWPVSAAGDGTTLHVYTVSIDPALSAISVRACFDGKPPPYLVAESLDAAAVLDQVSVDGTRNRIEPNGPHLKLGELPDGACVSYRTDLSSATKRNERGGEPTRRIGHTLITDLGIWLWRPQSLAPDEDIEVRFDLPAGISVSVPWQPVTAAGSARAYRVGHSAYDWPAKVVFGHFQELTIEVPGAILRVAVLEGSPPLAPGLVEQWLTRAAGAVKMLYGTFPVAQAQLVVVPGARGSEPVPWAYVLRGGAPSVHFFINQRRPLAEFLSDWTAVHELSHLLLPYVRPEDAWLSEGTASYYQNVLRARAGMIPVSEAWQKLHSGFRRGMKSMPGVTLADATERMFRDGAFMRVYWEGAAMMLLADQRLRNRTDGAQSLDSALAQLHACCLSPDTGWQARELFAKLDELTRTTVFAELYDAHVASTAFPPVSEAYRALGLELEDEGETIRMVDTAPQVAFRDAIMRSDH